MGVKPLRLFAASALFCAASQAWALSVDEARHLLTRTGFGAAPHEIQALLPLSREQAVTQLLDGLTTQDLMPAPAFTKENQADWLQRLANYVPFAWTGLKTPPAVRSSAEYERITRMGIGEMEQLRVWWLDQMISTPSPFAEHLALFWHGHFTSKYFTVLIPTLMYQQLQTLRKHGADNFADLLHAMLRDPAMLIFLDNSINTKKAPNENFARETLELFTLGVGNYSQNDIRELARIYAGHSIDFSGNWAYKVRPEEVDTGTKTFLGQVGAWTLDDAQRILLGHPRTAQYITEKFYAEFVSLRPDPAQIEQWAQILRDNKYALRPFLRAMLTSEAFWSPVNRGQLVKSPVDFLVGFMRSFGVSSPDLGLINKYAASLGQELFEPPSVQGWNAGMFWLSPQTVITRQKMLDNLWSLRGSGNEFAHAGANDLLVRYSAEADPEKPARFSVYANGKKVFSGHAARADQPTFPGDHQAKPAWDLVRIPRAQLPAKIHTVQVRFDKPDPDELHPVMYVNWMQVDGIRMSVDAADVKVAPGFNCDAFIPKGMMYCNSVARWTVPNTRPTGEGQAAWSLHDRNLPVNSHIEYTTARQQLVMRPAARAAAQWSADAAQDWRMVNGPADSRAGLQASVSAVPPLFPLEGHGAGQYLKALTLDPAYNLK